MARYALPAALALSLAGCGSSSKPAPQAEVAEPPAAEDTTATRLVEARETVVAREGEVAALKKQIEAVTIESAEKDQLLAQKDAKIKGLQQELETLRKRDTLAFGEARAMQRRGGPLVALDAFRKFTQEFPKSPLVADAEAAIAELTVENQRSEGDLFGPMRRENQNVALLRDGLLTPVEMAPLLRRKTRAQVTQLLGKPNVVFPDGNEFGYNDRGINPSTGRKGMLIVSFQPDGDTVSALRVDYAGRQITP